MANVSFEYFPGRSEKAQNQLAETVSLLASHQPEFQSVTFGAGGSDKNGTMETVKALVQKSGVPTASHLTYSGLDRSQVKAFADELWKCGFRKLVALRGDASFNQPEEPAFTDTAEFVASLVEAHPFDITVACYPETHPLSPSPEADLAALKAKQDAGAKAAITQFFFDNSVFYEFVERARAAGVTIPIVPGILPVYNFEKVKDMASKCGATIPEFVTEAFGKKGTVGSDPLEISAELLKAQVYDLACAGFETIHIYTLNRVPLADIAAGTFLEAHRKLEKARDLKVA